MISLRKKPKASQYNGNDLDKKLVSSLAKTRIPSLKQLKYIPKYLTKGEISALIAAILIAVIGLGFLGIKFYNKNLEIQPEDGGKYIEGTVGSPKYINPLYSSLNNVDADISGLIYSSLFKRDNHGYLTPDLTKEYKISEDQKSYIITIRDDVIWHNGDPLTIDDVLFTIYSIQNAQYKSPLRHNFNGVEVSKIDEYSLQFVLQEPYAPFMEFLTFGIMPQSLWQDVSPSSMALAELNLKPVGSGPYQFKSLAKDKNGNVKSYTLEVNTNYYLHVPYIKEIIFKFFVSPEEMIANLNNNKIDAISYLPMSYYQDIIAPNSFNFHDLAWPQMTGLFFSGKSSTAISNINIRQALAFAINKEKLISDALAGRARELDSPILPNSFAYSDNIARYGYNPNKAKEYLTGAGYELKTIEATTDDTTPSLEPGTWMIKNNNILTIDLTIPNDEASMAVADKITNYWKAIGVKTNITTVASRDIQSNIVQTRNFTVLLYSILTAIDPDPYAFWHSSQKQSLNITDYSNKQVDKLLEEARVNNNLNTRQTNYAEFQKILTKELPAIFLYSPNYTYIQNKRIKGFNTDGINSPKDRFANITNWYTKESKKLNLTD